MYLSAGWSGDGRFDISGSYPKAGNDYYYRAGERPEITVSASREPAVIAKEITRRLLPRYDALYAKVVAAVERRDAAEADRDRVAAALSAILPGSTANAEGRIWVNWRGDHHGSVSVHTGGSVTIELRSCTEGLAATVLAAVRDHDNDHPS